MYKNKRKKQSAIGAVSTSTYFFIRQEGFYWLELKDDEDAIANAIRNKGTLRVETVSRRIVWEL